MYRHLYIFLYYKKHIAYGFSYLLKSIFLLSSLLSSLHLNNFPITIPTKRSKPTFRFETNLMEQSTGLLMFRVYSWKQKRNIIYLLQNTIISILMDVIKNLYNCFLLHEFLGKGTGYRLQSPCTEVLCHYGTIIFSMTTSEWMGWHSGINQDCVQEE